MMNDSSDSIVHDYYDGDSFQALSLPCGTGGEYSMFVFLPREVDGLPKLEASLTPDHLKAWWAKFRKPEEIIIALPKYRLRSDLRLDRDLSALGMASAFDPRADFSGITGQGHGLFLSEVSQSTFIDVNEEGVEAASALRVMSPSAYGEEPPVFRADHPFLFLICDTRSGCIVFLGRVVNPT